VSAISKFVPAGIAPRSSHRDFFNCAPGAVRCAQPNALLHCSIER
jgi:hypothetical protein